MADGARRPRERRDAEHQIRTETRRLEVHARAAAPIGLPRTHLELADDDDTLSALERLVCVLGEFSEHGDVVVVGVHVRPDAAVEAAFRARESESHHGYAAGNLETFRRRCEVPRDGDDVRHFFIPFVSIPAITAGRPLRHSCALFRVPEQGKLRRDERLVVAAPVHLWTDR